MTARLTLGRAAFYAEPVILPKHPSAILACAALSLSLTACGAKQGDGKLTAEHYQSAASELKEPLGVISLFLPYLDPPKSKGKYDPRPTARDMPKRAENAAEAIRHASNRARQFSKSPVIGKLLLEPFVEVSRKCTRAADPEAAAVCKTAVLALDAELQKQGEAGAALGATGKLPRVAPGSITEGSNKTASMYLEAIGPHPLEIKVLAMLKDDKVNENELITLCESAAAEAVVIYMTFKGRDEDIYKLAVVHKFSIDGICNRLKAADGGLKMVRECKDKDFDKLPECRLACARAKTRINEGMPAAIFEPLPGVHEEICVKDQEDK